MELPSFLLTELSGDSFRVLDMFVRLVINSVYCFLIARFFYFTKSRRRDFFMTYFLVGFCIFMLMHLMVEAKIKTGIAMGLFAIFCILRYRTESVPIREMTYLFITIALAAINAIAWMADVSDKHANYLYEEVVSATELIVTGALFILAIWLAERRNFVRGLSSKYIKYDKIELIVPTRREELIADLKQRTGLNITKVDVGSIDFLKDMALIKIFYRDKDGAEPLLKMPKLYE